MASIVSAGTTSSTALNMSADTSGVLQLASNNGTTAVTIGTDQSVTFAGSINAPNSFGFKNRIINGAMVIDQRNAGASITPTNSQYLVDRWQAALNAASKFTVQQNAGSVTPPTGFSNYLGCTSSSAYSVPASETYAVRQMVEGFNFADMAWGTASAKTVTLSFWVYSSLTGTFGGALQNSAYTRSYPFSFTISSANTWTQISVTIAGDTTGTWIGATNGAGVRVVFSLGTGSTYSGTAGAWAATEYWSVTGATSVVGTNGATFYITGVQLEKGSTATSFDYRPYSAELAMCQRYFAKLVAGNSATATLGTASYFSSTRADGLAFLPVSMRTTPSFSNVSGTGYYRCYLAGGTFTCDNVSYNGTNFNNSVVLYYNNTTFSGLSNGAGWFEGANANASITVSAEL